MYDVMIIGSLFVELTPSTPGSELRQAHQYQLVAGGAAANCAFALAKLGMKVRMLSAVGDDDFADLLGDELASFGIATDSIKRIYGQQTPITFCAINGQGGKHFLFYRFPGHTTPMDGLRESDFSNINQLRLFDFSEGSIREAAMRELVFDAAQRARALDVPVLYAMNLRRNAWGESEQEIRHIEAAALRLADFAIMNEEELQFMTHGKEDAAEYLCREMELQALVITRGGDGNTELHIPGERISIAPYKVPVIYDVGAGDTFHAGLLAAMLKNNNFPKLSSADWQAAVNFAAATAAIRVSTSADPHDLPDYQQVCAWMKARAAIKT